MNPTDLCNRRLPAHRQLAMAAFETLENRRLLSTTYYVDPTGSDGNAGTSLSSPFQTIQAAADVADDGDTVLIRGGTYREEVRPANSGSAGQPITFQAYQGEDVVITATEEVTGGWSLWKDTASADIYRASASTSLPTGRVQVLVDGDHGSEARWNDEGDRLSPNYLGRDARVERLPNNIDGRATFRIFDASLNDQPTDRWIGATIGVHLYEPKLGTGTIIDAGGPSGGDDAYLEVHFDLRDWWLLTGNRANHWFYIVGDKDALSTPGEWHYEQSEGNVYVTLPNGETPSDKLVEIKERDYVFDLTDRSHITIKDVDIVGGTVTTARAARVDDLSSLATTSSHITIDSVDFREFDYASKFTAGGSLWAQDPELSGVVLGGWNNTLINSTLEGSHGGGVFVGLGGNNRVLNNYITEVGHMGLSSAVNNGDSDQDNARDEVVGNYNIGGENAYNTIENVGNIGLSLSGLRGGTMHHNYVDRAVTRSDDQGAIYGWNFDYDRTEVFNNIVTNVTKQSTIEGFASETVNRGFYMDTRARNLVIHGNIIEETTNFGSVQPKFPIREWHRYFFNNTLDGDIQSTFPGSGDIDEHGAYSWLVNNILEEGRGSLETAWEGQVSRNNVSEADYVSRSGDDYRLANATSSRNQNIVDQGEVIAPYTDGYTGSAPDIGAIEFGEDLAAKVGFGNMPAVAAEKSDELTIAASASTFVREDQPNTNFASSPFLLQQSARDVISGDEEGDRSHILVKFDVPSLAGKIVRNVRLEMTEADGVAAGDTGFRVRQITDGTFDPNGVTWNSVQDMTLDERSVGSYSPGIHGDTPVNGRVPWDTSIGEGAELSVRLERTVTADGGDQSYAFLLQASDLNFDDGSFGFAANGSNAPRLVIEYVDAPAEPNDAPANISLNNSTVEEDLPVGTVVGSLFTNDPDVGDVHTYTIVGGDTNAFTIDGNELKTAQVFDVDAKSSYSVTVRSTDLGGLSVEETFTVTVEENIDLTINVNGTSTVLPDPVAYGSFQDGQDGDDTAYELLDGGNAIRLTGNAWKMTDLDYTVTADTVLQFTVNAADAGEILGIALDNDPNPTEGRRTFMVGGSDHPGTSHTSWSWRLSPQYIAGSGDVTYTVNVGDYFTGSVTKLGFVADDDAGSGSADATFSDIAIFEDVDVPPLAGDANGDGIVNLADFGILRANFGRTDALFSQGDFTGDGIVNLADFGILRANFGNTAADQEDDDLLD
jgi:hypothetical protein